MKFFGLLGVVVLAMQSVSAPTVIVGSQTSTQAVRQPQNNSPFHDITSSDATCNVDPSAAKETISVAAGDTLGFELDGPMYHQGPVAIYLGQSPTGSASSWDGTGQNWFKIAEWGAHSFHPVSFSSHGMTTFTTTIPSNYLARIEQFALHLGTGVPEIFVSCAQIAITGGGSGSPSKVSIPGYVSADDPSVTIDIYNSDITSYSVPGPSVYTA